MDAGLIARFAAIVGDGHALTDAAATLPYRTEWRGLYEGRTPLVLRPGSTAEVSAILALANGTRTPVVPQSGNSGLVGGQMPHDGEMVLSLDRLRSIRGVDPRGNTMIVEAGVVLADAQDAADAVDRRLPLTLPSERWCRIGGNIATNAGGTAVIAYGSTRANVLGLEVVLADGRVWDGLRTLRKDNAGYDLKQVFIGSEGTLGIVTAAVLRLVPKPRAEIVALAGLRIPEDALELRAAVTDAFGPLVTACELMPRFALDLVLRHVPGSRDPLAAAHDWYVLIEVASGGEPEALRREVEDALAAAVAGGFVTDALVAVDAAEAAAFWAIRHALSEVQKHEGGSIKHDVSVPIEAIPAFLARASEAVLALIPGARPMPFGHLGDGNIHFNVSQPARGDKAAFLGRWAEVNAAVHAVVADFGGSIAAEHGIGFMKRDLLPTVRSPLEIELMRSLKHAFDPRGILNPGKVLA